MYRDSFENQESVDFDETKEDTTKKGDVQAVSLEEVMAKLTESYKLLHDMSTQMQELKKDNEDLKQSIRMMKNKKDSQKGDAFVNDSNNDEEEKKLDVDPDENDKDGIGDDEQPKIENFEAEKNPEVDMNKDGIGDDEQPQIQEIEAKEHGKEDNDDPNKVNKNLNANVHDATDKDSDGGQSHRL